MFRQMTLSICILLTFSFNAIADDDPILGPLPKKFSVYSVGTYTGTLPVNMKLDRSNHTVRQAEVVVNKPNESVVLVLTAYDPVVWRVGHTKDTKIVGILVSGYHGQVLTGVKKNTPIEISSYYKKGKFPFFFATGATPRLLAMNKSVKKLIGREINHFCYKPTDGVFYVGQKPINNKQIIYSNELEIKGYIKPDGPKSAKEKLDDLVKEKKLRLATKTDITSWEDKASEKYKRFNPDLRVRSDMLYGRTYVILKKMTLPNDLFGAHRRHFIIPDNVPFPSGPRCYNQFYEMDGTVIGPTTRNQ